MLIDAGYPVDDAQAEIGRIQARAFEAAARLANATGDNTAVREYLGLREADSGVPTAPMTNLSPSDDAN
ncbi:hypothetical protein N4G70_35660 [Streptomyces sp. ASQP_92]|uniref:hypothetical protein n=1 Tax=Streptomyces sp. ASQP_92 TaxID=2979116 RepID=UPI0021C043F4|nr:hypothetical protein [Streptomyces sp. ASQP_92]MCT9094145.1 hypothetical protein [Streptomyces sp. ASQP_92]